MSKSKHAFPNHHQPVLLEAVLRYMDPQPGERYLDLTAGYGGHARAIIERTGGVAHVLVDQDAEAIAHLRRQWQGSRLSIIHSDFETSLQAIEGEFDVVLADLGVSSPQLENPDRGFSFQHPAPLDMRMDQQASTTAADIVNTLSERDLADLIYRYGEERQSRRIARAIVEQRPLQDTTQLARIIARAYRGQSRIHPATRTFQALRIAVNDELGQLERSLPGIESVLAPGGRVGIISFHSLEDRLVKQFVRDSSLEPLHKHVIQGRNEDVSNPRARSAKLRAAIKYKNGSPASNKRREHKQEVRNGH